VIAKHAKSLVDHASDKLISNDANLITPDLLYPDSWREPVLFTVGLLFWSFGFLIGFWLRSW